MPSLLATSGTGAPAASSASAWRSLRTICSEVCLFFTESPPCAHLGRSDSHSNWISFRGAGQQLVHAIFVLLRLRELLYEFICLHHCFSRWFPAFTGDPPPPRIPHRCLDPRKKRSQALAP